MWIAIGLTLLWVFILAQIIVHFRNLEITGSWEQHRCDPSVMFTASMYNTDPTRSGAAFATENFVYCTRRLAMSVLATVFSPATAALDGLLDGAEKGVQSVGVIGSIAQRLFNGLQAMLNIMFSRYQNTYLEMRKTLIHLMSSMSRLHAAGIASVYMGISMIQAFFSAYEFVKKVVMIILGILLALLFLLFFALLPTIPLILAVIAAVGAGGGMASEFCFSGNTRIVLEGGHSLPISQVSLGQKLYHGGHITGILELDGKGVPLWNYHGVFVSGSHIIYDNNTWKQIRDTAATSTAIEDERLWCLITSDRNIYVASDTGPIRFRDYEEIDSDKMYMWWNEAVHFALGTKYKPHAENETLQQEGLHPCTYFEVHNKGILPLNSLSIGDIIRDIHGWTTITGIVHYEANQTKWIKYRGNLVGSEQLIYTDKWQRAGHQTETITVQKVEYSIGLFTGSRTFVTAQDVYMRDASEHDGSIDSAYIYALLGDLNKSANVEKPIFINRMN